jgi:putative ABC transport system ATP-binding protein
VTPPSPIATAKELTRRYSNGVVALDSVSFSIDPGEFIAITGPSGCGKSTLLHLLGGLDTPTSGELFVDGVPLHQANESSMTRYRRHTAGIVFQFFHLLPTMSALENVMLPRLLQGEPARAVRPQAEALLDSVGLAERAGHFPHQLSGGQMQRVAIARALIAQPRLLLADEPTGNLDTPAAAEVLGLFEEIASQGQTTLIVVTHSSEVAQRARRRIAMRDGRILP